MILSIKHIVDWKYICQSTQSQIEKDVIHKKSTIIDYNYIVVDNFMIRRKTLFKYETPFKGLYEIFQMWKN